MKLTGTAVGDYDHGVSTPYQTWPWPEAARTPSQDSDYRAGFKDGHAAGWNAGYEFQSGEKADEEEDREAALRSAIDRTRELQREKEELLKELSVAWKQSAYRLPTPVMCSTDAAQ